MTDRKPVPPELLVPLLKLRRAIENSLAEEAAIHEALNAPIEQIEAQMRADGIDLEEADRLFFEHLKKEFPDG